MDSSIKENLVYSSSFNGTSFEINELHYSDLINVLILYSHEKLITHNYKLLFKSSIKYLVHLQD